VAHTPPAFRPSPAPASDAVEKNGLSPAPSNIQTSPAPTVLVHDRVLDAAAIADAERHAARAQDLGALLVGLVVVGAD
jgi:hypothetical protein